MTHEKLVKKIWHVMHNSDMDSSEFLDWLENLIFKEMKKYEK